MVKGIWGKKIGMTQIFSENRVIPVTVIDVSNWLVTNIKTKERDGYIAIQVGKVKDRYSEVEFSEDWLKSTKEHFSFLREIRLEKNLEEEIKIGAFMDANSVVSLGDKVDAFGKSKGCGFAGVVRRHGFSGGSASHGSTLGRRPGSLSFMRAHGRVIKGKKLPGHMGNKNRMVAGLEVVKIESDTKVVLLKGSVPGKAGSLIFIRKA